jgi:hypothetical protein
MPYVFFGGEQALETPLRFRVVAIHIHQNLRRPAIVGYMYSRYPHQPNARIRQFALHQRFDLLAQSLTQPPAMILDRALLHLSPRSKTHENIRKSVAGDGPEVLLSRTKERFG